jgi:hypothetical protein
LALSTIGLSSTAEAKTVLDASARCFLIGLEEPGGWQQTIKIKPQKALSDKAGDLVQVTALEHGTKAVNPPLGLLQSTDGFCHLHQPRKPTGYKRHDSDQFGGNKLRHV